MTLDDSGIPTDAKDESDEPKQPEPRRHFEFTIPEGAHIKGFDRIDDVRPNTRQGWW